MAYDLEALHQQITVLLSSTPWKPLREVAHELQVSGPTVESAVRRRTGKSFGQFRHSILLAKATDLLARDQSRSLAEIAALLGYKSGDAFARSMRRACGKSPTELRLAHPASPKIGTA